MTIRDEALLANPTVFIRPQNDRQHQFLMRELARYTVGGNQRQVWNIAHHNVNLRATSAAPAVPVVIPGTAGLWAYQFSGVANLQLEFTLAMPADVLNNQFRLLFTVHWGPAAAGVVAAVQWKYELATQTVGGVVGAGAEPVNTVTPNTTAVAEDYLVTDFPNPIDCSTLRQTVIGRLWRDGVADASVAAVWLWRLQASLYEV